MLVNKKKGVMLVTVTLLKLVLLGFTIIFLIFIVSKALYPVFFGTNTQDTKYGAEVAFSNINKTITNMLRTPEYTSAVITIDLPNANYIFAGYDTNWPDGQMIDVSLNENGPLLGGSSAIFKPTMCKKDQSWQSCLCLYDGDIDEGSDQSRDDNVVVCQTYTGNIHFSGYRLNELRYVGADRDDIAFSSPIIEDLTYQYFFYYTGQGGQSIGRRFLYIEKIVDENNIYFLISPHSQELKDRKFYFSECSEIQDSVCNGKHLNQGLDETESASVCEQWSITTGNNNYLNQKAFCEYSEIFDSCTPTCTLSCEEGRSISEACTCGGEIVHKGFCYNGYLYDEPINCGSFNYCADYCVNQGSLALYDPDTGCAQLGRQYCSNDPCSMNCEIGIGSGSQASKTVCKSS